MPINYSDNVDYYLESKKQLIKLAVDVSNKLTTFALLEEIIELQGQFCYSETELERYNNDILILKCQLLYKKLNEYTSDLIDYEITNQKLIQFQQLIENFQEISTQYKTPIQEPSPENVVFP